MIQNMTTLIPFKTTGWDQRFFQHGTKTLDCELSMTLFASKISRSILLDIKIFYHSLEIENYYWFWVFRTEGHVWIAFDCCIIFGIQLEPTLQCRDDENPLDCRFLGQGSGFWMTSHLFIKQHLLLLKTFTTMSTD